MRKTLAVMAIMMFSIGAFADCTSSYLRASKKRDKRTKVLGITAMVGSIAGIAVSAPAGIILGGYLGGYTAF